MPPSVKRNDAGVTTALRLMGAAPIAPWLAPCIAFLAIADSASAEIRLRRLNVSESELSRAAVDDASWLEIAGLDADVFSEFDPNRIIEIDEKIPLLRVLYGARRAIRRAPQRIDDILSETTQLVNHERQADELDALIGTWFRIAGPLIDIEAISLEDELRDRFEIDRLYRANVRVIDSVHGVGDPGTGVTVYLAEVPHAWRTAGQLDGTVACRAVLVKHAGQPDRVHPILVADRLSWFPETLLGKLGMDVSLFDRVTNRTSLSPADRECFYSLLRIAGRADSAELLKIAPTNARDIVPLFNNPDANHGRLVALEGTARSAKKIELEDEDDRRRFGFDHYYEISVFTESSQGNPIVCCVLGLPASLPTGPDINEHVELAGFFFQGLAISTISSLRRTRTRGRIGPPTRAAGDCCGSHLLSTIASERTVCPRRCYRRRFPGRVDGRLDLRLAIPHDAPPNLAVRGRCV